jgi:uncharacterized protein
MNCPKCREVTMLAFTFQGIQVDRCPRCDGVWLDKDELNAILDQKLGRQIEQVSFAQAPLADDSAPAHCFRCDRAMVDLIGAADVRFEWCEGCEGLFFDKGEISIIEAFEAD